MCEERVLQNGRLIIHDILCLSMDADRHIGVRSVLVEGGMIVDVAEGSLRSLSADRHIEGKGKVALPGLINAHVHGDMLLARGLGDGLDLHAQGGDSFIGGNGWFRGEFDASSRRLSRKAQYAEALRGGTTYLCDFLFWLDEGDDLVGPFADVGVRGAVAFDYRRDFLSPDFREMRMAKSAVAELSAGGIDPMLQGPSEESYDPALLSRVRSMADDLGLPVHLHLSETAARKGIVAERFGASSVKYLDSLGFFSGRVVGSHGVYLGDEDMDILAEKGASVVSSPTAEMKIADGIAPVPELIARDVPVGLGSDGALWNDCSDMFEEMKNLMLVQRVLKGAASLSSYDSLYAATMGGARALGIDKEYGSIEKGKRASIAIVDAMKLHLVPTYHGRISNVVENIVSCAKAQDVETVIVDGEIAVERGVPTKFDEAALIREVQGRGMGIFEGYSRP